MPATGTTTVGASTVIRVAAIVISMAEARGDLHCLISRFLRRGFAHERRRLDPVRFGPRQLLAHRHAAAAMPALVGVQAAARPVHARKRLASVLGGRCRDRRQRQACHQQELIKNQFQRNDGPMQASSSGFRT
jgi:hypothetical protein